MSMGPLRLPRPRISTGKIPHGHGTVIENTIPRRRTHQRKSYHQVSASNRVHMTSILQLRTIPSRFSGKNDTGGVPDLAPEKSKV